MESFFNVNVVDGVYNICGLLYFSKYECMMGCQYETIFSY